MKINEDNILDDVGTIYSLNSNPSYSKDKMYCSDLDLINYLYLAVYNKLFVLPNIINPYYDRFYNRSYEKDFLEFEDLIYKYKKYYLELANNYTNLIDDNAFFHIPYRCKRVYTDAEFKELMLDFFNDQGVDKYEIVKSMFDGERVGTASLEEYDCAGFCINTSSGVKPYVVVKGRKENRINSIQAMHLAHEFGHAIEGHYALNRFNKNHSNKGSVFIEVSSMFYQLEFLRYLEKNKINIKDIPNLINYYHLFAYSYLKDLKDSDTSELTFDGEEYISVSDDFYVETNRNLVRPFKKKTEESDDIYWLEVDFYNPLIYGFGSYMAFHLSELKKQDPKEFNKAWNYYLSSRSLMDYEDIFKLFNLDVNKFVSMELIKPTIEQDLENYRRQLKRQL